MTLEEFFDFTAKRAAELFAITGEILPMWHIVDRDGNHDLIMTPWHSPTEKSIMLTALRETFRERGVTRYAFMSEAWEATVQSREQAEAWAQRVHDHPDRRETLTVVAEDRCGRDIVGHYYILRPEHSRAKLSPLHIHAVGESDGQTVGMLR